MELCWSNRMRQYMRLPDGDLECRTWGPSPAEATTVVLLHEGLGSVEQWRDFPEAICKRFNVGVFAYSRIGYGRSGDASLPKRLDYHFHEALAVLPVVLDAIAPKKVVFYGHSDGGTIATLYACRHATDARLAGLITVAPHYFAEDIAVTGIRRAVAAYEHGNLRERLSRYHDHTDTAFYGWANTWLNPAMANWDVRDELSDLRHPVLAIQGENDEYGTAEQIAVLGQLSHGSVTQLILPGCGHAPHVEIRATVLDAMEVFLEGLAATES